MVREFPIASLPPTVRDRRAWRRAQVRLLARGVVELRLLHVRFRGLALWLAREIALARCLAEERAFGILAWNIGLSIQYELEPADTRSSFRAIRRWLCRAARPSSP